MAITQQQFKKLKVGDLIEWTNTVTTDPNNLGVITQSHTFKSPNTQTMKFHQIKIKWGKYEDTCAYNEFDSHTLQLLTLIAAAKND